MALARWAPLFITDTTFNEKANQPEKIQNNQTATTGYNQGWMMLLFGANMCCVWLVSMTPKRYQAINYTSSFSALQGDQFVSLTFLKKVAILTYI